jgi:hypothetical protein
MTHEHYTGSLLSDISRAVNSDRTTDVVIDQRQANGAFGIYQARVSIPGDPRPYRLLLAPLDAPIGLPHGGDRIIPIDQHFAERLA